MDVVGLKQARVISQTKDSGRNRNLFKRRREVIKHTKYFALKHVILQVHLTHEINKNFHRKSDDIFAELFLGEDVFMLSFNLTHPLTRRNVDTGKTKRYIIHVAKA